MTQKYDLLIVGAGPAGLMAADVASKNGLRTALLERKEELTKLSRADGGILSPVNEYTFGQTLTFNDKARVIGFPVHGFSIDYDGPHRDMFGFNLYSPGGHKITFGDRAAQKEDPRGNRVGVSIDKELLLKGLLDKASKHGADIYRGINITHIETGGGRVAVQGGGKRFEAPFLIAADGVNSRIAAQLGLNQQRQFFATHVQYVAYYKDLDVPEPDCLNFIFAMNGTFCVTGRCRPNEYYVAASAFKPRNDLPLQLEKFARDDRVFSAWFKGGRKLGQSACVVNMFSPIKDPFKDNVLVIGDAAWLSEIANPGALSCGWKAAGAITLALIDGKANREGVASYLDWWDKYFYAPYGDREFKPLEFQDFFSEEELDYLIRLVRDPLIPTLDFYKLVSTIGNTYGELFPVIQEERPDVMAKLMQVVNQMEEVEEATRKAGFPNT